MNRFEEERKPISAFEAKRIFHGMNLEVSVSMDEADKHYSPHYHLHDVHLFVIEGGIKMQIGDDDWQLYETGSQIEIPAETVHEAKVEPTGWTFLVGIPNDAEHPFEEFAPETNPKS